MVEGRFNRAFMRVLYAVSFWNKLLYSFNIFIFDPFSFWIQPKTASTSNRDDGVFGSEPYMKCLLPGTEKCLPLVGPAH